MGGETEELIFRDGGMSSLTVLSAILKLGLIRLKCTSRHVVTSHSLVLTLYSMRKARCCQRYHD